MSRLAVAVFALGALMLAPLASAGAKNACVLVTSADVSSALHGKVGKGKHQLIGAYNSCTYSLRKKSVLVQTREIGRAGFDQDAKKIPGTSLEVPGLGDEAWAYFIADGIALNVWRGGTQINLRILGDGADATIVAQAVAKAALSRI
jgi:hypothetical protein